MELPQLRKKPRMVTEACSKGDGPFTQSFCVLRRKSSEIGLNALTVWPTLDEIDRKLPMLPPIPHNLMPAAVPADMVKSRPDIAPVSPAQASSKEDTVGLDKRPPKEAELYEEQRRRQRQHYTPQELAEGSVEEMDQAALQSLPRQGLWVDIEV